MIGGVFNATDKPICLVPVVGIPALLASCEAPGHAVGGRQQFSDTGVQERRYLDPKTVEQKLRALPVDRLKHSHDGARVSLSLAYGPDTNPHLRLEAFAIQPNVIDVVVRRKSLQNRHDVEWYLALEEALQFVDEGVIALDRQSLMLFDRQSRLGEDKWLAHVVLRDGRRDLDDAAGIEPIKFSCIFSNRVSVAAMLRDFRKGTAID
ncbi:hypothetical protein HB770_10995 [Rhizobium leguminosarum bv. viciae]|uniref:Uncharacterized protein n=1 Tax=Rhizobium leguminosarum bv. viciae TaxID=387 RepID=A0A7G6RJA0_RHILV|nr:hypothetical protein HB770_10995 [Rhizobium leguminosarum bv. viciae]